MRICSALIVASALIVSFAVGLPVQAQQQGTTSGPAVGTAVVPGTAAQKENPANPTGAAIQQGAVGVGAPGVPSKPGAEGGPSPRPGSGTRP